MKAKLRSSLYYCRTMGLFVIVWWLLSLWINNRLLLPSPFVVTIALWDLFVRQNFHVDILISLRRLAIGYILAASIGIPLGFILGRSSRME